MSTSYNAMLVLGFPIVLREDEDGDDVESVLTHNRIRSVEIVHTGHFDDTDRLLGHIVLEVRDFTRGGSSVMVPDQLARIREERTPDIARAWRLIRPDEPLPEIRFYLAGSSG